MVLPYTFGVELEMAVALVREGQQIPDRSENRIIIFPATHDPEDVSRNNSQARHAFGVAFYLNRVKAEFKRVIGEAGFPVASAGFDTSGWAVVGDTSIRHPPHDGHDIETDSEGYDWCGIEVKTPALPFSSESFQSIKAVCALIPKHFKILNNTTTGLHIHIGHGGSSFSTREVAKIMAFFCAFEPQLSTLHPVHRYSHLYGRSMRHYCNFSSDFQRMRKDKAFRQQLANLVHVGWNGKDSNYNFTGMADLNTNGIRPTIEFRQHEGTMDGEQIGQWVKLLIGMIDFIENEEYGSFINFLISTTENEKWQKLGDGKDKEREAEMGPTLADGTFTVIDLLQYIGLTEQAKYFQEKIRKHDIPPQRPFVQTNSSSGIDWMYQRGQGGVVTKSAEYQKEDQWRRLFEKFRIAKLAAQMAGDEWTFDEDDSMWPAHRVNPEFVEDSEDSEASTVIRNSDGTFSLRRSSSV